MSDREAALEAAKLIQRCVQTEFYSQGPGGIAIEDYVGFDENAAVDLILRRERAAKIAALELAKEQIGVLYAYEIDAEIARLKEDKCSS